MKKIVMPVMIFCIFAVGAYAMEVGAYAMDDLNAESIMDGYVEIYGDEVSRSLDMTDASEVYTLVPDFRTDNILSGLVRGESVISLREIFGKCFEILTREVKNTIKMMLLVFVAALLSSYLVNLQSGFGVGTAEAAFFACYLVIAGISAAAFFEVVQCGRTALENISVFMRAMFPVVLAGLASGGAVISATALETVLVGIIEICEWTIECVFIPMLLFAAAINIVNNLSERQNIEKLVSLLNKGVKWGLGTMLTLFVGVTGLQSIASGGADGLSVKLTKFAASNLIPVVGGILSESAETVMNCSIVIKNSVGVLGIIVVALLSAVPLLKIAASLIVFRLCAAVIQPIADKKAVKCISELADSISCVFSMLTAVCVMFVIVLTIVINIGNTALH